MPHRERLRAMPETPATRPSNSVLSSPARRSGCPRGVPGILLGPAADAAGVAGATIGFVISWYLIHHGWYRARPPMGHPRVLEYARNIVVPRAGPLSRLLGRVPAAVAAHLPVLPRLLAGNSFSGYMTVFELMMAACGVISAGLPRSCSAAQRVEQRASWLAAWRCSRSRRCCSEPCSSPATTCSRRCSRSPPWRRSTSTASGPVSCCSRLGTAAKAYPDRDRCRSRCVRVAARGAAGRALVPGGIRRGGAGLLPALPRGRSPRGCGGRSTDRRTVRCRSRASARRCSSPPTSWSGCTCRTTSPTAPTTSTVTPARVRGSDERAPARLAGDGVAALRPRPGHAGSGC